VRVALISDLHGNLLALETVLADLRRHRPDQTVCLGDVAAAGPRPRECVAALAALGCPVVRGNTDDELLAGGTADASGGARQQRMDAVVGWGAAQLSEADRAFLRSFRPTVRVELAPGAELLCFHGSPRSNTEVILATTPDDELRPMLDGHDALVYAGGHTHLQLLRGRGSARVINPGSVGIPWERRPDDPERVHLPDAEYALLEHECGDLTLRFRRLPIDAGEVRRSIRRSGMPHADWWSARWVDA
jgi:predicted phosphodiesterase